MIAIDLLENHIRFNRFNLWAVSNLEEFMDAHELMHEVFINEYSMLFSSRHEIPLSDIEIMSKLLSYFNDKYFAVFCINDKLHQELIELQVQKLIDLDIDVSVLDSRVFYILELNKIAN